MTRDERNTKLKHFITCLKCEVGGRECDDNCSVQYEAGNMGEIIENLEAISKVLEQESCVDAVSREAAIDAMYALCDTGETLKENQWRDNPHIDAVAETIEQLPSVNPQPKIGHWINGKCDQCGEYVPFKSKYCPNCGAKMQEVEE